MSDRDYFDQILRLLKLYNNNKTAVARSMCLSRPTLYDTLREMHEAGLVDAHYNPIDKQKVEIVEVILHKPTKAELIEAMKDIAVKTVGADRVLVYGDLLVVMKVHPEDEGLTGEELRVAHGYIYCSHQDVMMERIKTKKTMNEMIPSILAKEKSIKDGYNIPRLIINDKQDLVEDFSIACTIKHKSLSDFIDRLNNWLESNGEHTSVEIRR